MSKLRAVLDRINDVEATIAGIEARATSESALAYRLALSSLESRRDELREELSEITSREFIEVCDYRIIPDGGESYALSAVTTMLHDFQDLVTLVFDALIKNKPKQRGRVDADIVQKTRFDFGFAYSGSLGIALMVPNERLLGVDSDLDLTISAVFELMKSKSSVDIRAAASRFGPPIVRKLYTWSKAHSDYTMTADIKWVRGDTIRNSVLSQSGELAAICRIIEETPSEEVETVRLTGVLASWNTVNRRFALIIPEADVVAGYFGPDIDIHAPMVVQGNQYELTLLKHTKTSYVSDKEDVSWEALSTRNSN